MRDRPSVLRYWARARFFVFEAVTTESFTTYETRLFSCRSSELAADGSFTGSPIHRLQGRLMPPERTLAYTYMMSAWTIPIEMVIKIWRNVGERFIPAPE
jgi:hypothetical protein